MLNLKSLTRITSYNVCYTKLLRKTGKYFKYAIGEIVLVMIGILLALQINNWNENRKNNLKEAANLKSLKSELEISLEELISDRNNFV